MSLSWLQTLKSKTVWTIAAGLAQQWIQYASSDPDGALAPFHLAPATNAAMAAAISALAIAFRKNPTQHPAELMPQAQSKQ